MKTALKRMMKRVVKQGDCWVFTGCEYSGGYGGMRVWHEDKYKTISTNRLSWMIHFGDPGSLFVCHSCDNRKCVNPDHLWLGTNADNMADKIRKGRLSRGRDLSQTKLSEESVREIRRLYNSGEFLQREIAEKFSVSRENIGCVLRGVSWSYVK